MVQVIQQPLVIKLNLHTLWLHVELASLEAVNMVVLLIMFYYLLHKTCTFTIN